MEMKSAAGEDSGRNATHDKQSKNANGVYFRQAELTSPIMPPSPSPRLLLKGSRVECTTLRHLSHGGPWVLLFGDGALWLETQIIRGKKDEMSKKISPQKVVEKKVGCWSCLPAANIWSEGGFLINLHFFVITHVYKITNEAVFVFLHPQGSIITAVNTH